MSNEHDSASRPSSAPSGTGVSGSRDAVVYVHDLAVELARSWLEHLYCPAAGTVEAYVAARTRLVETLFPEFRDLPVHERGDLSFRRRGGKSQRLVAALQLIETLGIRRCVPETHASPMEQPEGDRPNTLK